MERQPPIGIYCRISKDPARLEVGVDRQRADCLELVGRLWPGADIRWLATTTVAADRAVRRPGSQEMLDALRGAATSAASWPTTRAA